MCVYLGRDFSTEDTLSVKQWAKAARSVHSLTDSDPRLQREMIEDDPIIRAFFGSWTKQHPLNERNQMRKSIPSCSMLWFKVTFLGWLSEPFQRLSDLQLGDKKVTLNHLVHLHNNRLYKSTILLSVFGIDKTMVVSTGWWSKSLLLVMGNGRVSEIHLKTVCLEFQVHMNSFQGKPS